MSASASASSKSKKKAFPEGAFFRKAALEGETTTVTTTTAGEKGDPLPILSLPCVDIGANLMDEAFEKDVDEVLARAQRAGLKAIVVTGTSLKASEKALAFAETKSQAELEVFATVGIHPHDAKSCSADGKTMEDLRLLAGHPKCVAIGECGLDFDRNFSPPDVQRTVFEQQVQLAKELGKPLFMHCREAAQDLEEIIARNRPLGVAGVVHCFTGTMEEMETFVHKLDLHIGITGWICDDREGRSAELSLVVKDIPKEKLMIETDAPYLTPRSIKPNRVRPWRNEPCLLPWVMHKVAQARGETMEDVASATIQNTKKFFQI